MAAFSTIGAIAGATALGGFLFGRKSKKAPAAAPAPTPDAAQAATPAAPPPPPSAPVAESTALAGAREAAQKVRKRIPGGGFAGGIRRPSQSQMGAGATYAPRTLIGA
jgi:hypothetical protein